MTFKLRKIFRTMRGYSNKNKWRHNYVFDKMTQ